MFFSGVERFTGIDDVGSPGDRTERQDTEDQPAGKTANELNRLQGAILGMAPGQLQTVAGAVQFTGEEGGRTDDIGEVRENPVEKASYDIRRLQFDVLDRGTEADKGGREAEEAYKAAIAKLRDYVSSLPPSVGVELAKQSRTFMAEKNGIVYVLQIDENGKPAGGARRKPDQIQEVVNDVVRADFKRLQGNVLDRGAEADKRGVHPRAYGPYLDALSGLLRYVRELPPSVGRELAKQSHVLTAEKDGVVFFVCLTDKGVLTKYDRVKQGDALKDFVTEDVLPDFKRMREEILVRGAEADKAGVQDRAFEPYRDAVAKLTNYSRSLPGSVRGELVKQCGSQIMAEKDGAVFFASFTARGTLTGVTRYQKAEVLDLVREEVAPEIKRLQDNILDRGAEADKGNGEEQYQQAIAKLRDYFDSLPPSVGLELAKQSRTFMAEKNGVVYVLQINEKGKPAGGARRKADQIQEVVTDVVRADIKRLQEVILDRGAEADKGAGEERYQEAISKLIEYVRELPPSVGVELAKQSRTFMAEKDGIVYILQIDDKGRFQGGARRKSGAQQPE